jgi:hypothetical protein
MNMVAKRIRKGKKPISFYVDEELFKILKQRAQFRGMTMTSWLLLAIGERLIEENKYL